MTKTTRTNALVDDPTMDEGSLCGALSARGDRCPSEVERHGLGFCAVHFTRLARSVSARSVRARLDGDAPLTAPMDGELRVALPAQVAACAALIEHTLRCAPPAGPNDPGDLDRRAIAEQVADYVRPLPSHRETGAGPTSWSEARSLHGRCVDYLGRPVLFLLTDASDDAARSIVAGTTAWFWSGGVAEPVVELVARAVGRLRG